MGLLLWGGVGTGKSFMAGCIANALMEQEVAVCMTNFARIMNELNNAFSGRNEVVDRLCGYPLLVIDDFGMERGTEYALEQIYNIIDSRYRSRKPLIVTTNLTLTELKNPQDTAHARIYDRLLELCTPIACTGPSMRKNIGQAKLDLLKTLLAWRMVCSGPINLISPSLAMMVTCRVRSIFFKYESNWPHTLRSCSTGMSIIVSITLIASLSSPLVRYWE